MAYVRPYSVREAAELLNVRVSAVRKMVSDGRLETTKNRRCIDDHLVRISQESLYEFRRTHKQYPSGRWIKKEEKKK